MSFSRSNQKQNWVAQQIDRLIVAGQSEDLPEKHRIYRLWNHFILPHFASVEDASLSLEISRSIPDSVLYGDTRRSTLPILLGLSKKLGVNLDDLLVGDLTRLDLQITDGWRIAVRRVLPREEVDRRITKILRQGSTAKLSINRICREVGIGRVTLRSRYPKLSRRLASGFHEKRRTTQRIRWEECLDRILTVLREQGQGITNAAIARAGNFYTHRQWEELCAEARKRALRDCTVPAQHADACLAAVASDEARSCQREKKGA
jgi:hypothetical protein